MTVTVMDTPTEVAPAASFAPKHVLRVLSSNGYTEYEWSPDDRAEVEQVQKTFAQRAEKEGYWAYAVSGEHSEVIHDFDATAPKIIMRPRIVGG